MPAVPGFKPSCGPTLPPDAPRIRTTAGIGTAGQKTWTLRRPVTVIGSGSHSTIVLTGPAVAKAHCAIINTAHAVLLKSLYPQSGTLCNGQPVDLVLLNDGDVIQIGEQRIQLAIQQAKGRNEKTAADVSFCDPFLAPQPVRLEQIGGADRWTVDSSVCLAGRHPAVPIHIDHPDVSLAHTVFFYFAGQPAFCDLGSRTGTWLNGQRQTMAFLNSGDQLCIGPVEMKVLCHDGDRALHDDPLAINAADLDHREAMLRERERRLDAREGVIAARSEELRRFEESLRIRERQLDARACRLEREPLPDKPAEPTGTPFFTGDVGSANVWSPPPEPTDDQPQPTGQGVDRAWGVFHLPAPPGDWADL
ncbi:MAG: FHA domain-containing protein [Phycisphaerales bacterium]|nr:MAG: FHA domain-containing protein [Phycisphaerales bacterium]